MSYKIVVFIAMAIIIEWVCRAIQSPYIVDFLKNKSVEIQLTLMAINTATSSFIVSKLQEVGTEKKVSFLTVYKEIKRSLLEQIILVVISIVVLTLDGSKSIEPYKGVYLNICLNVTLIAVFIFAIDILRDTGVSMFDILIELDKKDEQETPTD